MKKTLEAAAIAQCSENTYCQGNGHFKCHHVNKEGESRAEEPLFLSRGTGYLAEGSDVSKAEERDQ